MPRRLSQQVGLQLLQELVIVANHLQVGIDTQPRAVFFKAIEHVAITGILHHFFERIVVVLLVD